MIGALHDTSYAIVIRQPNQRESVFSHFSFRSLRVESQVE